LGKGAKKLVEKAAQDTTDGCTLRLFQRAAEHSIVNNRRLRRDKVRTGAFVLTAEQQHAEFVRRGHVPHYVENFVRGGHHFTAT
jgi:hypothetical protein